MTEYQFSLMRGEDRAGRKGGKEKKSRREVPSILKAAP
jgi:hypothetical protein